MRRAWLVLVLLAGCAPQEAAPRVLRLVQIRPRPGEAVLLNEPLVLHFSEEIERASVTSDSLALVDAEGRPARGEIVVEGRRVSFHPAPVLAPDLADGGFRPDTAYRATLAGFPRPEALRARSGAPLERTATWTFHTVDLSGSGLGGVFVDRTPETAYPLRLSGMPAGRGEVVLGPTDPIALEGDEPYDPSTVRDEDFELRRVLTDERGSPVLRGGGPVLAEERVPLRARLVDNRDRRADRSGGRTRIELQPLRALEPGLYRLRVDVASWSLRDFGGKRPYVLGLGPAQEVPVVVEAEPRGLLRGSYRESFLTPAMRSSAPAPYADGTARWDHTGRLEVRWPRAAGDGRDGKVVLDGDETRRDLQAVRLALRGGARCRLDPGAGLVVLRSQGALEIAGELVREGAASPGAIAARETLSEWLERVRDDPAGWTVLVAGGDLRVTGEVRVSGPLLLVAGGRIRIAGRVRSAQGDGVWKLGEGGGGETLAHPAPLVLDPPQDNPLVEPLRLAALSAPLPPWGGERRWRAGFDVGGHPGAGSFHVRFLPGLPDGDEPLGADELGAVDDPAALGDGRALHLWIELEVRPGPTWDPPWVDFVEFFWDRAGPSDAR